MDEIALIRGHNYRISSDSISVGAEDWISLVLFDATKGFSRSSFIRLADLLITLSRQGYLVKSGTTLSDLKFICDKRYGRRANIDWSIIERCTVGHFVIPRVLLNILIVCLVGWVAQNCA